MHRVKVVTSVPSKPYWRTNGAGLLCFGAESVKSIIIIFIDIIITSKPRPSRSKAHGFITRWLSNSRLVVSEMVHHHRHTVTRTHQQKSLDVHVGNSEGAG